MKTSCRSSALLRKGGDYLNVTINRAEMLSAIKRASAIAPADSPLDVLRGVLLEGGGVAATSILMVCANRGSGLNDLYGPTRFQAAAEAGTAALKGGALTEFEKLCDDAVSEYLAGAQMVPFGEAPLVGYLAARETEYTNLRILLMGRGAGLASEVIRSRLRKSYV